ncbi:MAG: toll/interleukin-1 receptor domain-containing protein, partial [Cytophagales bacterium]|nr:toll/interleukin-1 receptor domain-containing protein [Cytophagales bacterium]
MRILYLQNHLSLNGRSSLLGRKLVERLEEVSEDFLLGFMISSDEYYDKIKKEELKRDVIPFRVIKDFSPDIIYIEGGIFASDNLWKIPKDMAFELIWNGVVIIFGDTDVNHLRQYKAKYNDVFDLVNAMINLQDQDFGKPYYGCDKTQNSGSPAEIICYPDKMIISDWLRPAFKDVDKVIVSWPLQLSMFESISISGNNGTTGVLCNDVWVDELNSCPFGSIAQIGNGYVSFNTGILTAWTEQNEGNIQWILNTCDLLHSEAKANVGRTKSHYFSKHKLFLSHRSVDKPTVEKTASTLKQEGVGIWFDKDNMLPSDSLTKKISEGLEEMTHFVLFWSTSCNDSAWVDRELNAAISQLINQKK